MKPILRTDGSILYPRRAESGSGEDLVIGDGFETLLPGDPKHTAALEEIRREEEFERSFSAE
jgi:hypothetical protein